MLISMWSLKGGQGTSTAAALAAICAAQERDRPVRLVDLGRDQPAIFGAAEVAGSGLARWTQSDLATDALDRELVELTPNLSLLPKGCLPLSGRRADELVEWLKQDGTTVVDMGTLEFMDNDDWQDSIEHKILAEADQSLLVTRACYLALRRTVSLPLRPSGVVLVAEAGRALTRSDCERAIGTPVVATLAIDPDISRAVDAGMLRTRVPKESARALSAVVGDDPSPARAQTARRASAWTDEASDRGPRSAATAGRQGCDRVRPVGWAKVAAMKSATPDHSQPAASHRRSHLRLVQPSNEAPATQDAVRLVPAGAAAPDGWRCVTVAAEPDGCGVHQPTWEVQFDTAVIACLVRGEPLYEEVRRDLFEDDWEEVLCDRPEGAPQHGSFLAQRLDAPSLVEMRERSRLMHPSSAVDIEVGF